MGMNDFRFSTVCVSYTHTNRMWKNTGEDENSMHLATSDNAFSLSYLGTTHLQAEFCNDASAEVEVLVLLTRHVEDTRRISDFVTMQVEIEDGFLLGSGLGTNQQSLSSRVSLKDGTVEYKVNQRAGSIHQQFSSLGIYRCISFSH